MPIKKSAMKALRQTKRRTARNAGVKQTVEYLRRMTQKAMDAKDVKKAEELWKSAIKAIDKAMQRKVYKKNTGSRMKSRFAKRINALKAAK